jgi:hypothetical protein
MKPVSLKNIAQELETLGGGIDGYISTKTGKVVIVTDDLESMLDMEDPPEWAKEAIPEIRAALHSEEYIQLPTEYEIHEYAIIEGFCNEIQDEELRNELLDLIRGKGAFRRFKAFIYQRDMEPQWYKFRANAFARIVSDFLEAHNIPFVDDVTGVV